MTNEMLLHNQTRQNLMAFLSEPTPGVLITGQPGSGKTFLARRLASAVLSVEDRVLDQYPFFYDLARPADKKEIPIEAVRQIIKELRLKPTKLAGGNGQRVVLIDEAEKLSEEAQNALLKTLEEPPANTLFILTAGSETQLLPTIGSRLSKLSITPVSLADSLKYFDGESSDSVTSAWQLSQGAPGLLNALLSDENQHQLKLAVNQAKLFLQKNRYERLLLLDSFGQDRTLLGNFLDGLSRVLAALHQNSIKTENRTQIRRLSAARKQVNSAMRSLELNTSVQLINLDLALRLPI